MTYTNAEILAAARAAIEEKGANYVYTRWNPSCTYANAKGAPSCLVGHIVKRLDPEAFKRLRAAERATRLSSPGISIANSEARLGFTDDQLEVLVYAQDAQDTGAWWGKALSYIEALDEELS